MGLVLLLWGRWGAAKLPSLIWFSSKAPVAATDLVPGTKLGTVAALVSSHVPRTLPSLHNRLTVYYSMPSAIFDFQTIYIRWDSGGCSLCSSDRLDVPFGYKSKWVQLPSTSLSSSPSDLLSKISFFYFQPCLIWSLWPNLLSLFVLAMRPLALLSSSLCIYWPLTLMCSRNCRNTLMLCFPIR